MDKIRIRNLEVFGNHGVYPEENRLGQKFLVSAELELDIRTAGNTDDLTQSVNYGQVSHFITDFMTQHTYKLIEAAAEHLARAILLEFPLVQGVHLAIHKPWAPIGLPLEDVAVEIERSWHTVYLACGSNMGEKEAYIRKGIEELAGTEGIRLVQVSKLIETEPYGVTDQDMFLNGCMEIKTLLTPEELLACLHQIEKNAGRERKLHWGPRTLDLDIIFYDDLILHTKELTIPHMDMQNRSFVLEPLSEIAPYMVHPIYHKMVMELKEQLNYENNTI